MDLISKRIKKRWN